eukprot:sb/3467689/
MQHPPPNHFPGMPAPPSNTTAPPPVSEPAPPTPQQPAPEPVKRDVPLSSILSQVSSQLQEASSTDQPPALEHVERAATTPKPDLPAMPMLKPAPSFVPNPGDNVPLSIPDIDTETLKADPDKMARLWSEVSDSDVENHALTIEVERNPPPKPDPTPVIAAPPVVPATPEKKVEEKEEEVIQDVQPDIPYPTKEQVNKTSEKDENHPAMPELRKGAPVEEGAESDGDKGEKEPETPTGPLSRDNELLQFAKLVDKLHSNENSSEETEKQNEQVDEDAEKDADSPSQGR